MFKSAFNADYFTTKMYFTINFVRELIETNNNDKLLRSKKYKQLPFYLTYKQNQMHLDQLLFHQADLM